MAAKSLEDILKGKKRAILVGIGGGGDVVGTIPTSYLLDAFGIRSILGGLSWERAVLDPIPGPRTFKEVKNAVKLNESVWLADAHTTTQTGVRFAEAGVAEVLGEKTVLIDINKGATNVAECLLDAADKLECDLIVGIDVGGDAIALGDEPGLASPLADSIMISSLYKLSDQITTFMGVFGLGSDGELTIQELERSFKIILLNKGLLGSWGITPKALETMEKVIEVVPTEASRAPVEYAKGIFKDSLIRKGTRYISLNLSSISTYYLDIRVIYERISKTARAVFECGRLEQASQALNKLGLKTELDIEREYIKRLEQ